MPNSPLGTKDRPIRSRASLMNGESSTAFLLGEPLAFKEGDPTQVVTSTTATAARATSLFAGLSLGTASAGSVAEFTCAGYHASARFVIRTRAATSDSWSAVASVAAGVYCTIDTVNRAVVSSGAGAASAGGVLIAMVASRSSVPGTATATSDTATVQLGTQAVWIRNLG